MIYITAETHISYCVEDVAKQFKIISEQLRDNPNMFKRIYVRLMNNNSCLQYSKVELYMAQDNATMFICLSSGDKRYIECVKPDDFMMIDRITINETNIDGSDRGGSDRYHFEFEDKQIDLYMNY